MPLITCNDCKQAMSTDAKACPNCGAKPPAKTKLVTKLVAGFIGLVVLSAILGRNSTTPPSPPSAAITTPSSSAPSGPPSASAPPRAHTNFDSLRKKVDPVEKVTWRSDASSPSTAATNNVQLYLGTDANHTWLRLRMSYAANNWLFIQRAIIMIDGTRRGELSGIWERDNNATIWEWLDIPVLPSNMQLLRDMANAKTVLVRYEGRQYHADRTLTSSEQKAMRKILAAYDEVH